jgi:phage terminase large subunit-like protein
VIDKVDELAEKYDIAEIAVDRWNINQAVKRLEAIGKEHGREEWLVGFSQNFSAMSAPIKELETMVVGGSRIAHDGNPVLRWMFGNVQVVRDDAGNVKFTKSKSTEKIDAMVALTMALGRAMVAPQQEQCVYDTRGVEFI